MLRPLLSLGLVLALSIPGRAEPSITPPQRNQTGQPVGARKESPNSARVLQRLPMSWDPSEQEANLLTDLADGQLDDWTLWEASLIVGGASRSQVQQCSSRWNGIQDELRQRVVNEESDVTKAMQVFRLMHQMILTGDYHEHCNAFDRALLSGDYNCVTATVLFCCLARQCDVSVKPESLPGHVRCCLTGSGTRIETTDPRWRFGHPSTTEATGTIVDGCSAPGEAFLQPRPVVSPPWRLRGRFGVDRTQLAAGSTARGRARQCCHRDQQLGLRPHRSIGV